MPTHIRTINNSTTGWSFDLEEDTTGTPAPGGLILKNVRHDGHNFAKDVRLIGIWLKFERVDPTAGGTVTSTSHRFVTLDSTYFNAAAIQEDNRTATSPVPTADVSMENYFYPGYRLRALYVSTSAVFAGLTNSVMGELRVTQSWQFSPYGNNPPHEPSGGLSAARFHPVTTYRLVLDPNFDPQRIYTRVASIRFDYRIHLTLDRSHSKPDPASSTPSNHAGIFRDSDNVPLANPLNPPTSGARFSAVAFESVEKPLALEVIAPGLHQGLSAFDRGAAQGGTPRQQISRLWDNVHWWGSRTTGHISAPGAFHAAHMHWRWGAPVSLAGGPIGPPSLPNIGNFLQPLPFPDSRQHRHRDYLLNGSIYGALVDPGIWAQNLRVAVTKHVAALDPATQPLSSLSTRDFDTLFTSRGNPQDVFAGADQVLWYSVEIPREVTTPVTNAGTAIQYGGVTYSNRSRGSIFLHGMFFAHDAERTGQFIGSTTEAYWPNSRSTIQATPTWVRYAT